MMNEVVLFALRFAETMTVCFCAYRFGYWVGRRRGPEPLSLDVKVQQVTSALPLDASPQNTFTIETVVKPYVAPKKPHAEDLS